MDLIIINLVYGYIENLKIFDKQKSEAIICQKPVLNRSPAMRMLSQGRYFFS